MDKLNGMSNVCLDSFKLFLHIAGPKKMSVSFKQTAHKIGFLCQVRNEGR